MGANKSQDIRTISPGSMTTPNIIIDASSKIDISRKGSKITVKSDVPIKVVDGTRLMFCSCSPHVLDDCSRDWRIIFPQIESVITDNESEVTIHPKALNKNVLLYAMKSSKLILSGRHKFDRVSAGARQDASLFFGSAHIKDASLETHNNGKIDDLSFTGTSDTRYSRISGKFSQKLI